MHWHLGLGVLEIFLSIRFIGIIAFQLSVKMFSQLYLACIELSKDFAITAEQCSLSIVLVSKNLEFNLQNFDKYVRIDFKNA